MTKKIENAEMPAIIDYKEYGLVEETANQITSAFTVNELEHKGYFKVYGNLLTQEITKETCIEAGNLRRKLVTVRTNYDKIHKAEKAFYLAGGRYVDAYKNKKVAEVEVMESKLIELEKYFENIDKEKKNKIENDRKELLKPYPELNLSFFDLRNMDEPLFQKLLKDQIDLAEFKQLKAIQDEKSRIAAENKFKLEQERISKTVIYKDFIPNYDSILFADLTNEEFENVIREAIGKKMDVDVENERIRLENQKLLIEKQQREKQLEAERLQAKKREDELKAKADFEAKKQADLLAKQKAESDAKLKAEQAEKSKLEAELKAKKDADILEAKRVIELEKKRLADEAKAAKAPDKNKLNLWINNLVLSDLELKAEESKAIENQILTKFDGFKKWALTLIETI